MRYQKQGRHLRVDHKTGDEMLFLKQRRHLRQNLHRNLVLHADQHQQDNDDHSHDHELCPKQQMLMY
jgi:hypothetical protein